MQFPTLYAVVDQDLCVSAGRDPRAVAQAFARAGVSLIQVRAKHAGAGDLLALVRSCIDAAPGARVIVNDRADLAVLSQAGGVHVGQDDLSPSDARAIVGQQRWVGVSTHDLAQVRLALDAPVDYIAIGPVFATGTKATGYDAVGLGMVREVAGMAARRRIPVVAIGGITLERASEVLTAGAASVCVISDLLTGEPEARAAAFLARTSALQSRPGG